MLILQIALGIVLGSVLLASLPLIMAGIITASVYARKHWIGATAGCAFGLFVIISATGGRPITGGYRASWIDGFLYVALSSVFLTVGAWVEQYMRADIKRQSATKDKKESERGFVDAVLREMDIQ